MLCLIIIKMVFVRSSELLLIIKLIMLMKVMGLSDDVKYVCLDVKQDNEINLVFFKDFFFKLIFKRQLKGTDLII